MRKRGTEVRGEGESKSGGERGRREVETVRGETREGGERDTEVRGERQNLRRVREGRDKKIVIQT